MFNHKIIIICNYKQTSSESWFSPGTIIYPPFSLLFSRRYKVLLMFSELSKDGLPGRTTSVI